jgi:hypothetical protein
MQVSDPGLPERLFWSGNRSFNRSDGQSSQRRELEQHPNRRDRRRRSSSGSSCFDGLKQASFSR